MAFACSLGTEMQFSGVRTFSKWRQHETHLQKHSVLSPRRRPKAPSQNQQPHPPASQQFLACSHPYICGAITVRGALQKYSLQSRGLKLALYLLWDLGLETLDSSNILIFLLISQLLGCACVCVSLCVSVHFDQLGVTVRVAFVIAPLADGFLTLYIPLHCVLTTDRRTFGSKGPVWILELCGVFFNVSSI